jgi:hypothetical protein
MGADGVSGHGPGRLVKILIAGPRAANATASKRLGHKAEARPSLRLAPSSTEAGQYQPRLSSLLCRHSAFLCVAD